MGRDSSNPIAGQAWTLLGRTRGEAGFGIGFEDGPDEAQGHFFERRADAELKGFLTLGADVDVEEVGAEEAEGAGADLVAGILLGQTDGLHDDQ